MSGFKKQRPGLRGGPKRGASPRKPRAGGRGNQFNLQNRGFSRAASSRDRGGRRGGGTKGGTKGGGTFTGPSTDMGPTVQAPPGLIDPGALLTMFA